MTSSYHTQNMKFIIIILIFIDYYFHATTASSVSRYPYYVWTDQRLSEEFRGQYYQLKTIVNVSRILDNDHLKRPLWQCLISDPAVTEITLFSGRSPDVGPFSILSEFGDHLCTNVTQTVKCYEGYLESISAEYLKEKPLRNVNSKLVPLQRILSKVCDKSGKMLNTQTQNILKCIDGNSELYHNCRDGNLGMAMHNVGDLLGVIPYYYEYSCRQLDVTEECVRETIKNCNSIGDANFVGELVNEIRSTPICEQAKSIPKRSLEERIYQVLDIDDCPFSRKSVRYDGVNITMCPNLPFDRIVNNIVMHFKNENWSGITQSVCPHLPQLISCIDTMGTVVSDCLLNDYKHFPQQGFKPMQRFLESVCSGLVPNIDELIKSENYQCWERSDAQSCLKPYEPQFTVIQLSFPAEIFYLDYESYTETQLLQQCLLEQLQACDADFVNGINATLNVLLDEVSKYPITYIGD